ncbi:MAG: MaoC family dehydratase N-terminal domain-containing protein [Dehalococcoidia bacterium]
MTEPKSLITDEHRALIGKTSPPRILTINAEDALRMRDVIGDRDPRWADGTGNAPPYAIASITGGPMRGAPTPRILPGGILTAQEWRFTRFFKLGETISAVQQLVDIRDRLGGRYGYSILMTTATDYYDAEGNHIAASLNTATQFDPAGARSREGGN